MAATETFYRRLPGTGYRRIVPGWVLVPLFFVIGIFVLLLRGNRVQLWQGGEHLLFVEWSGYKEKYKRFHYRDIQAFIFRKTIEGKIINGALAWVICVFVVLTFIAHTSGVKIAFLIIAGSFGLLLLINWLAGPTCQCFLRTAVQIEELPSLTRVRLARKVIARLKPLIAAAQGGGLSPEMVSAQMRELAIAPAAAPSPITAENPNAPPVIS
jgi:hypothetical protein